MSTKSPNNVNSVTPVFAKNYYLNRRFIWRIIQKEKKKIPYLLVVINGGRVAQVVRISFNFKLDYT